MKPFTLLFFMLLAFKAYSQIPSTDANWSFSTPMSDEFNTINTTDPTKVRWQILDECSIWGISRFLPANTYIYYDNSIGENVLRLKGDNCSTCSCNSQPSTPSTGGIKNACSPCDIYGYGYFEVKMKSPKGVSVWPAVWGNWGTCTDYNEIDLFESDPCEFQNGNKWSSGNWHKHNAPGDCLTPQIKIDLPYSNGPDLSLAYHKYAFEWSPKILIFYFDDVPYGYSLYDQSTNPSPNPYVKALQWLIDLQIAPPCPGMPSPIYPLYMDVAYFHYYKLKQDCNTVVNAANLNFTTFNYAVKKSITINSSTIPNNSNVTLRATDFTQFNNDFTVPVGSQLSILPTPCPN